jgi:GT2 family glycosyltransferase
MTVRYVGGAAGPPAGDYDADVVILSLDRAAETVAAIHSALAQTGVSRHVFVVDQGSRPEIMTLLADAVAGRQDATLLALDHNHGVAGGRNQGSALGHGRVIFGLDNDAEFADCITLAHAIAALDADPMLAAVGCRILLHANGDDDLSSWGYPISLLPCAGETFDTVTFVGAGHAIRRAAWHACGGYDDALHFCWEEFDFCLRAIEQRWRVQYRGDTVIRHKVSAERRFAWSGDRWFYFVRNRLYIGRKWGVSWVSLALRFVGYLFKGARNGVLWQTVRALPAAIRMSSGTTMRRHSPAAQAYLRANDTRHRDWWLTRPWREAMSMLAGQDEELRRASVVSRSRSSKGTTAGLSIR